jgi:hypothetical protein
MQCVLGHAHRSTTQIHSHASRRATDRQYVSRTIAAAAVPGEARHVDPDSEARARCEWLSPRLDKRIVRGPPDERHGHVRPSPSAAPPPRPLPVWSDVGPGMQQPEAFLSAAGKARRGGRRPNCPPIFVLTRLLTAPFTADVENNLGRQRDADASATVFLPADQPGDTGRLAGWSAARTRWATPNGGHRWRHGPSHAVEAAG